MIKNLSDGAIYALMAKITAVDKEYPDKLLEQMEEILGYINIAVELNAKIKKFEHMDELRVFMVDTLSQDFCKDCGVLDNLGHTCGRDE